MLAAPRAYGHTVKMLRNPNFIQVLRSHRTAPGVLALAASLAGCQLSKQEQLENVAKDWCMTIRASQVIPVYPLTEDIHPGDVFLVQVPVDRQQEIYKKRGFLPLDNHLARIHPSGYEQFYNNSFLPERTDKQPNLMPRLWIRPDGTDEEWGNAPGAAFPTYTFQVNRSVGFNLALPISGVPVGLSLLGTDSAYGSVAIKESKTIGVDIVSLEQQLQTFAAENRAFLSSFGVAPDERPRNFLRVITRVYSTGELDVQLSDARSVAAGGDIGVPRPVDNFIARTPTSRDDVRDATNQNYEQGLERLNSMLADRDVPTHASGDDSNLTPAEIKQKREARAAELKTRRDAAVAERDKAKGPAADAAKARDEARKPLDQNIRAVADKDREIDLKSAALEKARKDGANEADLTRLENELDAAKAQRKQLADAQPALQKDWSDKAAEAAKKAGTLEVAEQAVSGLMQALPGGSLRVSAAASRFIALTESFDPPLVIGYLGFDVPILLGGTLGEPIPTHATIDPSLGIGLQSPAVATLRVVDESVVSQVYETLKSDDSKIGRGIAGGLDRLAKHIPAQTVLLEQVAPGQPPQIREVSRAELVAAEPGSFADYAGYRARLQGSADLASKRLACTPLQSVALATGSRPDLASYATPEGLRVLIKEAHRRLIEDSSAQEYSRLRSAALQHFASSAPPAPAGIRY